MASGVKKKVDVWKNKLLDLGKKNRLINYRETKRSTLSIIQPEIFTLWEDFVQNSKPLEFPYYYAVQEAQSQDDELENELYAQSAVKTNQSVQELQRTLRNLRNKAKMAIEEQGINILYLSFGFLRWSAADYGKNEIVSPIVLVPVSLTVDSISSPFVLQMTDDEIVVNPALKYKLENDLGLTLPEFDEEQGLENYLKEIQSAVKNNSWSVVPEVGLSLFSFLKINMYNDLERNKENIAANPIVRAIAGTASAIKPIPEDLENYDFDHNLKPSDVFQVVDADSSQQEAILCAKKGYSFVLQGPPGTGKSQTITNIIAECLADGKKVLFVSEKMAALDVVHKRLTSAGLDDFCLVLHSHKANKKAVLEQLRTSLNLAHNKAQISDDAYIKLETLYQDKEKLNQYAEQIFAVVSPLNMTIYQVNGILAGLDDYPEVIFSVEDVRNTTFEKYTRYLRVLDAFKSTIGKMTEDFDNNPWRGAVVSAVTNELRHDVNARFPKLSNKLSKCVEQAQEMFRSVELDYECSYDKLKDAKKLFSIAKGSPCIPYSWMTADTTPLLEEIRICESKTMSFTAEVTKLQQLYKAINEQGICSVQTRTAEELNSLENISAEQAVLAKCLEENPVLSKMAQQTDRKVIRNERQRIENQTQQILEIKKQVLKKFSDGIWQFDYQDILSKYKNDYFLLLKKIGEEDPSLEFPSLAFELIPEEWLQAELTSIVEQAQSFSAGKQVFYSDAEKLKGIYTRLADDNAIGATDIDRLTTLSSIEEELNRLQNYVMGQPFMSGVETGKLLAFCKHELAIAEEKASEIQKLQTQLLQDFDREIFSLDYESMLARYKLEYGSFLKYFKGTYHEDQRRMKLLYKNVSKKMDDALVVSALTTLKEIAQIRLDIDRECEHLVLCGGNLFRYEETEFQSVKAMLATYEDLQEARSLLSEMKDIIGTMDPEDIILKERYGKWYKGLNTAWNSVLQAVKWTGTFREEIREDAVAFAPYCVYENGGYPIESDVLKTLLALEQIQEEREKCSRLFTCFISVMGEEFDYENTDFNRVDAFFTVYDLIVNSQAVLSDMATEMKELLSQETELKTHYEFLYAGMVTPWAKIRESLGWLVRFKEAVSQYAPNEAFVKGVCTDSAYAEKCKEYADRIFDMLQDIYADFDWFLKFFEQKELYQKMNLQQLSDRIQQCTNGLFLLEEWIDFVNARKDCEKEGLSEYIQQIEIQKIPHYYIIPAFKKRFFHLWLDAVLPEYPAVLNFRRMKQEKTIFEFAKLDRMQFEIAKARIKSKLINDLPLLDKFTNGMDEVGILRRELGKQRRIMPLRRLFRQIPNLLLVLKPCLMMSPLSVSLFLEADTYQFDTVIFDEASQVCTENAIGAIARGKQVIIAGDSKQLPPTNFFAASTSDTDDFDADEDEGDDSAAYESILDEASLLPEKTLLWHYRSRHEHLIAFSNAKIYHNNLITFPSNVDRVPDNGVEYVYVQNGFYDRGGRKGNVPEAKRVAELVFEHFKKHPRRSLGVVAFGEVQQQAIEMAIGEMRMQNQQYELFFNEDKEDAFFIKNLENVQGDERDTIIFSIGYAKDAAGIFRMNFGPLSKSGGERRLNVAITRAKYNIKLVGSILPTDIDVERVSSEGPKLLRSYIEFAINGVESLQREVSESDVVQHDSPFEKAVYDFLDRKGYKLATQVGCSGYRIDMAVKHPTISGCYVLGIECDGAAYHSAKTARERDRLRQDVLESMGWKIYRIWSTDWIKDPVTEGKRLIEAVEDALKSDAVEDLTISSEKEDATEFVSLEEKKESIEDMDNPYGFKEERVVSYSQFQRENRGYTSMADYTMELVNDMYPVHYDLLCQQMAPLFGNMKATVKVKREVDSLLLQLGKRVIRKGDFFYPRGYKVISPRMNNRKINYIAVEELAEAMCVVLRKSVGLTKESVCAETARAYNFHRMTQNITSAMNSAFELLAKQKRIAVIDGKVSLVK